MSASLHISKARHVTTAHAIHDPQGITETCNLHEEEHTVYMLHITLKVTQIDINRLATGK